MRAARVFLAATLCLAVVPAAPAAAPSLVADPPAFDFGVLEGDTTVTFLFALRNEGDEPLRISAAHPTCGCTDVFFPDSLVLPGGSVPLTGNFSTRKLEGETKKTILVESNDPERRRAVLLLKGWVQRKLTVFPEKVYFHDGTAGAEKKVLIRPGRDVSLTITGIEVPAGLLGFRVSEGERPGDRVLHLILLPGAAGTVLEDTVRIRTNVEGREEIEIEVTGAVKAPTK